MKSQSLKKIGDPSTNKQSFTDVKLKILCCRYWKIDLWDCYDMAFPFWRIYWNKNSGGTLTQNQNTYKMDSDTIYVIPPFTSFSTKYENNHIYKQGINVSGRHIEEKDNEEKIAQNSLLHLFIHFNLGVPFDNVYPGIFKINMTPYLQDSDLAKIASMATNSFSRLFKQKMNMTLHAFIMKRKIAQSCELLLHTNKSIEEVAFTMGFSDRYHFSRVFKSVTGTTPAVYKSGKFS